MDCWHPSDIDLCIVNKRLNNINPAPATLYITRYIGLELSVVGLRKH